MRISRILRTAALGFATRALMQIPAYRRQHSLTGRAGRLVRAVGKSTWLGVVGLAALSVLARRSGSGV